MKRLLLLLFINHSIPADYFTDLLQITEDKPSEKYYQLLPRIDEENPSITFIRSRNLKNFSLENNYISMLEEATHALCFIETGTYLGDTTEIAAKYFPSVYTIELGKDLFEKAQKRFSKKKNISLHLGDSTELLPCILKQAKDKSVIFLDAHFSMGTTVKGEDNTPIITELNHIKKSKHTNSVIIIDDIRMFYDPLISLEDSFMGGYPSLNTIVEKILEINPYYKIAIVYDTLIAFTDEENITVSPVVRAVTMSRLYDGSNYLPEHLLCAELCIAESKDKEKEMLIELAEHWVEKFSETAGLSRHYALWAGLIMLHNENYKNAKELFLEAKKEGLKIGELIGISQ